MPLTVGEPLPSIRLPGVTNPDYVLDSAAGRYLLLALLGEADDDQIAAVAALLEPYRDLFDDTKFCFFGMLPDTARWRARAEDQIPGLRWLFDTKDVSNSLGEGHGCRWLLVDPTMRVLALSDDAAAPKLLADVAGLPEPSMHGGGPPHAPVLFVPRIFEPDFCKVLIEHYNAMGGQPSGFMREIDGVTRLMSDVGHKRRSDVLIQDEVLANGARIRLARRLAPEIAKTFQFQATRIERYLVSCYDAATGGYFKPHRDNTTKGTAHRRFAVSINLNADFDGGDLRFPEFGTQTYRPPPGGAVVFSCALLHEATPVTRGRRYAFLPFLYDEANAQLRSRNLKFVENSNT